MSDGLAGPTRDEGLAEGLRREFELFSRVGGASPASDRDSRADRRDHVETAPDRGEVGVRFEALSGAPGRELRPIGDEMDAALERLKAQMDDPGDESGDSAAATESAARRRRMPGIRRRS